MQFADRYTFGWMDKLDIHFRPFMSSFVTSCAEFGKMWEYV